MRSTITHREFWPCPNLESTTVDERRTKAGLERFRCLRDLNANPVVADIHTPTRAHSTAADRAFLLTQVAGCVGRHGVSEPCDDEVRFVSKFWCPGGPDLTSLLAIGR